MSLNAPSRTFEPGTTGWTSADLDDPRIEHEWLQGRYEIVEGVLTKMPPAYFAGGNAVFNLIHRVKSFLESSGSSGRFSVEVDIIINEARVVQADAAFLTADDERWQMEASYRLGRADPRRTRILIPSTLLIESVSPGHEMHDERTKRRWYAEFGVRNYWILDGFKHSLECHVLDSGGYRMDVSGAEADVLKPSLFPELMIRLGELWTG